MTTATPPPAGDDLPDDPAVDHDDAGFPDSPELADGDEEFVDDQGDPVSSSDAVPHPDPDPNADPQSHVSSSE